MSNLISGKEAFEAMMAGKQVLCRYTPANQDFDSLDHFAANVYVLPEYEFCIKIEMLELAGIKFTKPLVPQNLKDQQEIYIVMPTCILRTKYDAEHVDIHNAVMNGFAQADADNALLQLKALGAVFGNAIESVEVKDGFEEKPKRQRKPRETKITVVDDEVSETLKESEHETASIVTKDDKCQLVIDAINVCNSNNEIDDVFVLHNLSTYEFSNEQLMLIEDARRLKSSMLYESITNTSHPDQKTTGITITKQGPISVVEDKLGVGQQVEQHWEHQEILNDLLERASKAQTPAEANALFKYTKGWTQEQSAPLHAAVSRRLQELPQPEAKEPPSLLVRIQNAPDLTELDALEIDVSARDPQIVPALMAEVLKRRKQLEAPVNLIDEAFP